MLCFFEDALGGIKVFYCTIDIILFVLAFLQTQTICNILFQSIHNQEHWLGDIVKYSNNSCTSLTKKMPLGKYLCFLFFFAFPLTVPLYDMFSEKNEPHLLHLLLNKNKMKKMHKSYK